MTPERFKLLDELGFKWSSPTPARARRNKQVAKKGDIGEEQKEAGNTAPTTKSEEAVAAVVENVVAAVVENVVETPTAAQAEAMTAATNVVGNLSAVVAATEENLSFEGETIVEKAAEATETVAQDAAAPENENDKAGVVDGTLAEDANDEIFV